MPTTLQSPINERTITSITLDSFGYTVARNGDMTVSVPGSKVAIGVAYRDADGTALREAKHNVMVSQLPVGVRQAIKAVHEAIIQWAKDNNKIQPGTEIPDF